MAAGPKGKKSIEAEVIRILNNKEIIINKGQEDGIVIGDRFIVGDSLGEVYNPHVKESYGHFLNIKETLEVITTYPRFSVLAKVEHRTEGGQINVALTQKAASIMAKSLYGETKNIELTLPVNEQQIKPFNKGKNKYISLGDLAILKI